MPASYSSCGVQQAPGRHDNVAIPIVLGPVLCVNECTPADVRTGEETGSALHQIESLPAQRAVQQVVLKAKAVNQGHCIWPELPQQGVLLLPD